MVLPKAGRWAAVVLAYAHSLGPARLRQADNDDSEEDLDDFTFWLFVAISVGLVVIAGLMSGLTLGLMSLDVVDLEILKRSGKPSQKKYAERIVPVLRQPHVLLVTLLVCNAIAAEALPLFLDRLADPVTAVLVSVTVVLLFGEIIPQALCSRYGLQIGATAAPFVRLLMWVTAPLSYPIGWVLDRILGERHTALFRRAELKALVDIHKEGQEFGGVLSADEVNIIKGALDMTHKIAGSAMTPLDMVFMLPSDALLDEATLTAIIASGHSRIPVHKPGDRSAILGILLVKELIMVDKDAGQPVGQIKIRSLPYLRADTPMYDMLKLFEIGRSHMAVLTQPTAAALATRKQAARQAAAERDVLLAIDSDDYSTDGSVFNGEFEPVGSPKISYTDFAPNELEPVGIITIEDVLEELLQSEIVDETDQFIDNLHVERVNAALLARGLPPHLRRALSSRDMVPRIGGAAFMTAGPATAAAGSTVGGAAAAGGVGSVGGVGTGASSAAIAAAAAAAREAAEAGIFRSPRRAASEDPVGTSARQHRVTFGHATVSSPPRPPPDAATIAAVAAALSPRCNASHASLASLASHHGGGGSMHSMAGGLTHREGPSNGTQGFGPSRSRGGSMHGAAAAAAALTAAAERSAERRAGHPPLAGPPRRSQHVSKLVQDQMDLLQPLLLRRVRTADASLLRQLDDSAGGGSSSAREDGIAAEHSSPSRHTDTWQ